MKITTAWTDNGDGEGHCLVCAYSETDFDNWGKVPDWYGSDLERARKEAEVRELVIHIPDYAVSDLFQPKQVDGRVEG